MTHRERIEMLKETIRVLYVNEGRSKSYISKLLEVDRRQLTNILNKEWEFEQGNTRYLRPSNQKFLNKHKTLIKSRLDNDITITDIAKELGTTRDFLTKTIIPRDTILERARQDYLKRIESGAIKSKEDAMAKSSFNYEFEDLKDEEWREILGHEEYLISNHGRVKKHIKRYDSYILIATHNNIRNNRVYVWIDKKGLQVSRLVGFAFVGGFSDKNNTINHLDRDVNNNSSDNLEWVSQSDNNQHSYDSGRNIAKAYSKNGKFKKIILNNQYEFKTIVALAKFLDVSVTQANRCIDGECESPHKLEFIY